MVNYLPDEASRFAAQIKSVRATSAVGEDFNTQTWEAEALGVRRSFVDAENLNVMLPFIQEFEGFGPDESAVTLLTCWSTLISLLPYGPKPEFADRDWFEVEHKTAKFGPDGTYRVSLCRYWMYGGVPVEISLSAESFIAPARASEMSLGLYKGQELAVRLHSASDRMVRGMINQILDTDFERLLA